MDRKTAFTRTTRETDIFLELDPDNPGVQEINTAVPFLDHMLTAMSFHGAFSLKVTARGDLEVEPHHLVEDVGLVLGEVLDQIFDKNRNIRRFSHQVIPMDEALAEIIIDVCGRPTLVYRPEYPQDRVGNLDMALFREFFIALATRAKISLHVNIRYGENSHHMIEGAFKALGKALKEAYTPREDERGISTKGSIS